MNERICNLISTLFLFLFLFLLFFYCLFFILSLFSDLYFYILITLFYLLNMNCNSTFATLRQERAYKRVI